MTLTEYHPQIYPFFLWVAKGADDSLLDEFEIDGDLFSLEIYEGLFCISLFYLDFHIKFPLFKR